MDDSNESRHTLQTQEPCTRDALQPIHKEEMSYKEQNKIHRA